MLDRYLSLVANHGELFEADSSQALPLVLDKDLILEWQAQKRKELAATGLPEEWASIGVVWEDEWVLIIRDLVRFPGGHVGPYIRLLKPAAIDGGAGAAVLAEMGGRLLLLTQFRHATRSWHLEIPRGFGTRGMSAEETARTEVEEEVQGTIDGKLIDLHTVRPDTGLQQDEVVLFFARLRSVGEARAAEGIRQLRWVSVPELEDLIASGEVTDAFTIAAYTRARLAGLLPQGA